MGFALANRSTLKFEGWSRWSQIPHDVGTHVQIVLSEPPNQDTERWDGATSKRAATAAELETERVARENEKAEVNNYDIKLRAAILGLFDAINAAQPASQQMMLADLRAAINARYRAIAPEPTPGT